MNTTLSTINADERWRLCVLDEKGDTHCFKWCASRLDTDLVKNSVQIVYPDVITTIVPCNKLTVFLDTMSTEHEVKRKFNSFDKYNNVK